MLKQGLLGSEVLAMLMVRTKYNHNTPAVYTPPFHHNNVAVPNQVQPYDYKHSYRGDVPIAFFECDCGDEGTGAVNTSIPRVLLDYLFETIGDSNHITINSTVLNHLVAARLTNSIIKLEINSIGGDFNIVLNKKSANDNSSNSPWCPYGIEMKYTNGNNLSKDNLLEVIKILDDIFSTLTYDEYSYLKNFFKNK